MEALEIVVSGERKMVVPRPCKSAPGRYGWSVRAGLEIDIYTVRLVKGAVESSISDPKDEFRLRG